MASASHWPLTIFSNCDIFFFGILTEGNPWPQDNVGGILFLFPLQVAVFRPVFSGRLGTHMHGEASPPSLTLQSPSLFTSTVPPFLFLRRVGAASGVFPRSSNYEARKSRASCIFMGLCVRVCVAPVFCLFQGFPCCRTQTFPRGVTVCEGVRALPSVSVSFAD